MRGTLTTMIFRGRDHLDVAVRAEAHDHSPWISNAKEKPDQDNGDRGFLCHRNAHLFANNPMYAQMPVKCKA